MLRVAGVSKRFGAKTVLDQLHVEFPSNAVSFLMGPNGAGKSTLIKCILGLHDFSGHISWNEQELDPGNHKICPVFEDAHFHHRLTGFQNIDVLAPESRDGPVAYLSHDVLSQRVKGYSHGQRMRLALMIALNSGAELILLDEPRNGLDRDAMLQLKRDVKRLTATTTFLITGHNLEFYDDIVDHTFLLKDGRISVATVSSQENGLAHTYDENWKTVPK